MSLPQVKLREWERATPDRCLDLAGRRLPLRGPDSQAAELLNRSGRLEILELARGLELRATSWVGRLTLAGLSISIWPKIDALPLLTLMRYAYGLRNLHLMGSAQFPTESLSFEDLLIAQLISETSELLVRGLHRDYRRTAEILETPRGRIDFGQYVLGAGRGVAALPCQHHPRTEQTPLNLALYGGLSVAAGMTSDLDLRVELRRLAARFDLTMKRVRLDRTVLGQAWRTMDRRTSHYRPALVLSGMLMEGKGLSFEGGGGRLELPGFLFDMNAFFQALISRLLRDHLDDAEILDEHRLHQVFYYDPAHNPLNRRGPVPRPDFVVRREHRTVAILDAKYRDLWECALPREMLYQLAVYALSQSVTAPSAVILYPTLAPSSREQVVVFQDVLHARAKARVILRPVNLLVLAELLRAGRSPHAKRGLRALVQGLVVGEAATTKFLRAA